MRERLRGRTARATRCALIGLLGVIALGFTIARAVAAAQAPAASAVAVQQRVRLAVLPFSGPAAGVPEEFGQALAEAIRQGLRQVRGVRLIESGAMVEAGQRLNISVTDVLSDDAAMKLAREMQARGLVTGSFRLDGGTLKVQSKIVDTREAVRGAAKGEVEGQLTDFPAGQERIVREIVEHFHLPVSPYDEKRVKAAFARPSSSAEAYTIYARAMWYQGLGTRESRGRAIALFEKALAKDRNFALAHYGLSISRSAGDSRWQALDEVRMVIQLAPTFADGYRWLGDLLLASPSSNNDQVVQAYQKALDLAPDCVEAYAGLGNARQARGRYDEAIVEYRKALALEPENARVHYGLGKIYYNEKQLYHEAVAEYEQAIELDPRFIEPNLSLGEIFEEKGLYKEAAARYSHALSIEPRHPGAMYGLALAYEKVDAKRAIEQWERYIELASTLASEKEWVSVARTHLNKLRRGE